MPIIHSCSTLPGARCCAFPVHRFIGFLSPLLSPSPIPHSPLVRCFRCSSSRMCSAVALSSASGSAYSETADVTDDVRGARRADHVIERAVRPLAVAREQVEVVVGRKHVIGDEVTGPHRHGRAQVGELGGWRRSPLLLAPQRL